MPDFLGYSDEFEGVIDALGLNIPEGTAADPADESRIRWLDPDDGEPRGVIYTTQLGADAHVMAIRLEATGEAGVQQLVFALLDAFGSWQLRMIQKTLEVIDDGAAYSLIDLSSGGSRLGALSIFPQLAAAPDEGSAVAIDYGTATVPAAGAPSNTVVVNHALGRVPDNAQATPAAGAAVHVHAQVTARTNTQITIRAHMDNEANIAATDVDWLVFG